MKALYFEPMKDPVIKDISNTLEALQEAVGGYIEAVTPTNDPVVVICNETGKLNGSLPNRSLIDHDGNIYDHLYGSFLVCGFSGEDFTDIPDELIDTYKDAFGLPILAFCDDLEEEEEMEL